MNIILMGYRGAGKTAAGRILAAALKRPFYDTDERIVARTGRSVAEIVAKGGWPAFREAERTVVQEISRTDGGVISVGGGAVLDEQNVAALKPNGLFVWLVADAATLAERMGGDRTGEAQRPSLTGRPVADEVTRTLAEREPLYRRLADLVVDTETRTPSEVAAEIRARIPGPLGA